ncbi:MAG: hypothetical protein HOO06_16245 [Bdellovibrionaceae bacterium]|mgnify:CR=1 FL=1|jgi:hypothetical protein|nr:hypothetical protein [Pseudobdellovibrionaceae bacterium]
MNLIKPTIIFSLLLTLVSIVGCEKDADNLNANISNTGGYCKLDDKNICIEFNDNVDGTDGSDSCITFYGDYSSSSRSFLVGVNNDCDATSPVGYCTLTDAVIYYTSGGSWNDTDANTNCGNYSGTYEANP